MYLRAEKFVKYQKILVLSSPPCLEHLAIFVFRGPGLFCVRLTVLWLFRLYLSNFWEFCLSQTRQLRPEFCLSSIFFVVVTNPAGRFECCCCVGASHKLQSD